MMSDNHDIPVHHLQNIDNEPFVFGQAVIVQGVRGFYYRGRFGVDKALVDNEKIFPPWIVDEGDVVIDDTDIN